MICVCVAIEPPRNAHPCIPSPCGPNSECRELDARAVCSCGLGMLGAPPNCRPECIIHQECPSNRACISQRCQDPCVGSCGFNARCITQNHQPICSCIDGYDGDPYASCTPRQSEYRQTFYSFSFFSRIFAIQPNLTRNCNGAFGLLYFAIKIDQSNAIPANVILEIVVDL